MKHNRVKCKKNTEYQNKCTYEKINIYLSFEMATEIVSITLISRRRHRRAFI